MAGTGGLLRLWLNAFIPRDVVNYTKLLAAGPHAGKTAIPLPGVARTNPMNWLKDWEDGFLTDQRPFSDNPAASVRMQSLANVNILATGISIGACEHRTSGTTEVNLKTGAEIKHKSTSMSRCRFYVLTHSPHIVRSDHVGKILHLTGAANDPLVSASADIDYEGEFQIVYNPEADSLKVSFAGLIDAFPAFECYGSFRGVTKPFFQTPPPPGHTVVNLLGRANTKAKGSISFE